MRLNNIVLGTVNRKIAPRLRVVYDQMPKPKYVAAMESCVITGGLYFDSYNVLPGVDNILLADVYVLVAFLALKHIQAIMSCKR